MKQAAPINSPMASYGLPEVIAAHVEKRSGPPFPNASSVTPANVSLRCKVFAMKLKLAEKKLSAHIPIDVNSSADHNRIMIHASPS